MVEEIQSHAKQAKEAEAGLVAEEVAGRDEVEPKESRSRQK